MPDESKLLNDDQPLELIPNSPYESRHEFVEELAYRLWTQRGRPLGSPDVDWFSAERAVYTALAESGMITASPSDLENMERAIYH